MQVAFSISQKTLERLEWGAILEQLADRARTPQGRARLLEAAAGEGGALFEPSAEGVRERLTELEKQNAGNE